MVNRCLLSPRWVGSYFTCINDSLLIQLPKIISYWSSFKNKNKLYIAVNFEVSFISIRAIDRNSGSHCIWFLLSAPIATAPTFIAYYNSLSIALASTINYTHTHTVHTHKHVTVCMRVDR